jgi:hypothetical protein
VNLNLHPTYVRFLLALLAGVIIYSISWANTYLQPSGHSFLILPVFTIAIYLIWECSSFVSRKLEQKYSWKEFFYKRIFFQLLYSGLLIFPPLNIIYLIFKLYSVAHWEQVGSRISFFILIIFNGSLFLAFLLVTGFQLGSDFLKTWKMTEIDKERLLKESTKARLESLKSQLNPHFMFNNLNILTVLIQRDPNLATEFVEKFSEVYRYVMQSGVKELVPLRDELEFLESYIFLLSHRFSNSISFHLSIDAHSREKFIPPLALQLLIENAVRHNKATQATPLKIEVTTIDGKISVKNNLQRRIESEGTGMGLANISARYDLLSDKKVEIIEQEGWFEVRVPLLEFAEV